MSHYILDARTATVHFPGIGRYVRNLTAALIPQLTADERLSLLWNPASAPPAQPGAQVELIPTPVSPFSLDQQWRIPLLLRRRRPALYHSPYYVMPYCPGLPTLLTFYDIVPLRYPQSVSLTARLLFRPAMTLALRAASHVVAVSEAARGDLMRSFSVPPATVSVTPLAADPRFRPQPTAEVDRIRDKYRLPPRFLLYFGSNKPHKNLSALIDAYAQLPARHATPLVIAGAWDSRYPQSRQRAAQRQLGDSVYFLGPVDEADLPALYQAAMLFVFPSLYEGFGLPVLEAMACGTPVACANTASLSEIAGDACRLFNPNSAAEIREAIAELLEDSALRTALTERGLARARAHSWQATAAATLRCYRDLKDLGSRANE